MLKDVSEFFSHIRERVPPHTTIELWYQDLSIVIDLRCYYKKEEYVARQVYSERALRADDQWVNDSLDRMCAMFTESYNRLEGQK